MSFSTELEQDMIAQIDEYIDNREVYKIKRDLSTQAAADFYKTLTYKGD
jgi:RNA-binding protein YhbY|tara:strand:- start:1290 stop:1436 length:147 start_codon:yes stop_codon:yes gene_type:complete